jgi:ComF family protein
MCAVLQTLSQLGRETARIVLHASCVVCGGELPWRARTDSCCGECWRSLPLIAGAKCQSCAQPFASGDVAAARCIGCMTDPLPVGWTDAWGHYRGALERVLHAFKFQRHDWFSEPFADALRELVLARGDAAFDAAFDAPFDAVVPVPMSRAKLRRRGYNQAELLGRALARRLGLRCDTAILAKRLERRTQSTLDKAQRAANVRGAFAASARGKSKSILLVDDVCTTGETLRACASALLAAGAARVCAVVVAKAT